MVYGCLNFQLVLFNFLMNFKDLTKIVKINNAFQYNLNRPKFYSQVLLSILTINLIFYIFGDIYL